MKKIIVQPYNLFWKLLLLIMFLACVFAFAKKLVFFIQSGAAFTFEEFKLVIFIIGFLIFIIFIFLFNDIKISEILIFDNYIELVYRNFNNYKIVQVEKIEKDDIKKFDFFAKVEVRNRVRKAAVTVENEIFSRIKIILNENRKIVFDVEPSSPFFGCEYEKILDILAVSKEIPNFQFSLKCDNKKILEDIQHFRIYGTRIPFLNRISTDMIGKNIFYNFLLVAVCIILFMLMPVFVNIYQYFENLKYLH